MIREAVPADITQLVHVHVTSWNATYAGYHPKPTPELRTMQWQKLFKDKEDNWFCYVVEKEGGELAGFATGSSFYDASLPYKAELNKIHFPKTYQRLGLGRLLVAKTAEHFLRLGINSMLLFADPANPNTAFYEKLGGEKIVDEKGTFHGAYGWKDIRPLFLI